MPHTAYPAESVAHLVDQRRVPVVEVMGPLVEFLTTPAECDCVPCTMRGTIPAGAVVPLHAHADPETYFIVSGEAEGLAERAGGRHWLRLRPGDVFHVPGGAKHGFRNRSPEPAVMLIVSTSRIGRFFLEIGNPVGPGIRRMPPSAEAARHFLATAERYGYWNATREENAQVGLDLPRPPQTG